MLDHRLSLVMTKEIYYAGMDNQGVDFSKHMVCLYPYAKGEKLRGACSIEFNGEDCEAIHIYLNIPEGQKDDDAVLPNNMQRSYLKHLLERKLLLDVLVDWVSISEVLLSEV